MSEKAEPEINWDETRPQIIKLALELGPLVIFFIMNGRADIFVATAWFMAAMVISLALSWLILKKVAVMPLVTGVVVLVFGGLTLWLQDDTFIKIKPTITNTLFASVLLGGLIFGQSLLKYVFGDVYKLKPEGWWKLTLNWGLFFIVLAVLNEVVWRSFSTDFWVAFKVWGIMPLTVVFSMSQLPLLNKYAPPAEPAKVPPVVVES
ncbi:intracellular septation protein [Devosia subaequoris]|uniref:Inner membrane-spanning protein YciB n=1 Tax=Devosia subaequoris TaxID=395930 RepID=A0A7W6IR09_9HYPH|nr:septation protein A [Devosia subaequoris]MBB4053500.1 intracellular septation protein [Devosia subaequoris]MCP1210876.1 septation protein A [Devosia subaequoris]